MITNIVFQFLNLFLFKSEKSKFAFKLKFLFPKYIILARKRISSVSSRDRFSGFEPASATQAKVASSFQFKVGYKKRASQS
jgi:hypothetical protein